MSSMKLPLLKEVEEQPLGALLVGTNHHQEVHMSAKGIL